jgi:5-methylcytosine-specific restriction endonuclease McrA
MLKLKILKPFLPLVRTQRLRPIQGLAPNGTVPWRAGLNGANARGYTYEWQQESKAHLCEHPLCAECHRKGRVTAASLVDHITPHRGDASLFWDRKNWQSLCDPCHREKTAGGA